MLMICDDESVQLGPEEIARRPDHAAWIEYMERRGVMLLDVLAGTHLACGHTACSGASTSQL
jgi:hypothetical protein